MPAPRFPAEFLSPSQLSGIEKQIVKDAEAGRDHEAWEGIQSLLPAVRRQEFVAQAVARLVEGRHFSTEQSLELLTRVYEAHPHSEPVLALVGVALDCARDIGFLNAPPPDDPLFVNVVNALSEAVVRAKSGKSEVTLLQGLVTAARMLARQRDDLAEMSCRRLIELQPKNSGHHYNLGLFLKSRGRFREGMLANQTAADLRWTHDEATEWNLGICATGAAEADVALAVWKRRKHKIEIGRFGLPDGKYPDCKVRLAQRPLAERSAVADDPGSEETIWIERLSPCHGIIRSVLVHDVGVDYGDVILFDGAPITEHTYGEKKIPVFPHLATLRRNHYQMFDFAGTQAAPRQIHDIDLEWDAVVYSHTENFRTLCAGCWQNPDLDHAHHDAVEKHVVSGRIAAPPDRDLGELLRQLDAAVAGREGCRVYAPRLCEAAGFPERAAVEQRRFNMIRGS